MNVARGLTLTVALLVLAGCGDPEDPPIVTGDHGGATVSYKYAFYGITAGVGTPPPHPSPGPTPANAEYDVYLTNVSDVCERQDTTPDPARRDDLAFFFGEAGLRPEPHIVSRVAVSGGDAAEITGSGLADDGSILSGRLDIRYLDAENRPIGQASGSIRARHCSSLDRSRG